MNRLAPAFAAGLLLVAACSRPQPSPEYERARALWTEIVKARADEASQDPRADEVLALLAQVPAASADATAAAELRTRIEADRKARAEEQARRERLVAQAGAPQEMPSGGSPQPAAGGGGPGASGEGAAPPPALRIGMPVQELEKGFGDCFARREPVRIGGGPDAGAREGDLWVMKDDEGCRARHAALAGQGILVAGGQVAGVSPLDKARKVEVRQTVELGTLPDGGTGMRVDGGVVPIPPGATLTRLDGGVR
ncbi:MAG TPA: hypothetical protein VFP65_28235 [Anaeromyxobacteraceae bacterium]|nr:hypothetical protein [Anaeromyxobacteraceae bacterium]